MADISAGRVGSLLRQHGLQRADLPAHHARTDNDHCSCCGGTPRPAAILGIGGTHADPKVVDGREGGHEVVPPVGAFLQARRFYGISEEIHLHVLPAKRLYGQRLQSHGRAADGRRLDRLAEDGPRSGVAYTASQRG